MRLHLRGRIAAACHRAVPDALIPFVVAARARAELRDPHYMEDAKRHMSFLLGGTHDRDAIDEVARRYITWKVRRAELRWHPARLMHQRVKGLEHLARAQEQSRGVIVAMMHYGPYEGAPASIFNAGGPSGAVVVHPDCFEKDAPPCHKQYLALFTAVTTAHSAGIGTSGFCDLLSAGRTVIIGTDVPGSTPLNFLGHDVLGASGAAWAAWTTNTPVVVLTYERDDQGWYVRLHRALAPNQFTSAPALMQEITNRHTKHILACPEAYLAPLSHWGIPDAVKRLPESA
jgi:lauroyl/myristoyl acyltransferase